MWDMYVYYLTGFIMVPVIIFAFICQLKVNSNYKKFSKIANSRGMTGADAAYNLLRINGITDVKIRNAVIPATKFGSTLGIPLALFGIIFNFEPLIYVGIILYSIVALFQLITLPVEFNASKRALQTISANGFLVGEEYNGAKKVLTAAALTYVAALASSLATLLRLLIVARRND